MKKQFWFWLFLTFIPAGIFVRHTLFPYSATSVSFEGEYFPVLENPSVEHPFGTSSLGQDIFVRIIDGISTAVLVLLMGTLSSLIFGLLLTWISFIGGKVIDRVISTLADALYSIPSILIALAVLIGFPSQQEGRFFVVIGSATLGVTLFFGAKVFRTLRINVSREMQSGYFHSALALGLGKSKIFVRHVLPNSFSGVLPIITSAGSEAILTLAGLGFIGLGVAPTEGADWGYDLARGVNDITQGVWWTSFFPAIALAVVISSLYFVVERQKND